MSERASRWDAPASGEPAASGSSSSNGGAAAAAPAAAAPAAGASSSNPGVSEAAQAAAAIAAKIAASLRPGVAGTELIKRNMEDEGFVKDIEVNDLRNRYVLTKASTQKQIEEETGASVVTKGVWVPDRTKLGPGEIPLYLHIVAQSQVSLDLAVRKVNELIDQELGPLIDERTMVARNRALGLPPPATLTDRHGRPKWPEAKLPIGLESMRNFNVRAKTVGPGGMFVKYIQAETGARVQIKGMGSGFLESDTGREAEEPMHINIAAPNQDQVDRASTLAADLLEVVRQEYEKARSGGGGPPGGMYNQGGYGGYQQGQQGAADPYAAYYQQQAGQPGATPDQAQGGATPAAGAAAGAGATPQQGTDAWAQYAAYWAAYGYDVNDPQFQAWQASQYGQQGQQQPGQQTPAA